MIQSLYIKDFALIDELDVRFGRGLNILTGQTGAGKSIIIGALNLILGERADTDMIRQGSTKAIAEATIHAGHNQYLRILLEDNEVEWSDPIIIRREVRDTGSRAFVNDTPVNLNVLRKVGDQLVDLHGQHDHQLLLREDHHQQILDGFGNTQSLLSKFHESYDRVSGLRKGLNDLKKRERELQEKLELYRFQLKELEQASLDPEEEETIDSEMQRLDNAEELDQTASTILEIGSDGEVNITDLFHSIERALETMSHLDPGFENYLNELHSARISFDEMLRFTDQYRSQIEFNPKRLEFLRQRQADLNRIKKKYTRTIPNLIEYREEIRTNLNLAENFDVEIEKLTKEIHRQTGILSEHAVALHREREKTGKQLSNAIVSELSKLGIEHAQFTVNFEREEDPNGWIEYNNKRLACTREGFDIISLHISTNKGEDPKPLSKIASGGEISRVMLAMKTIIAREQSLPVMIFDEIDTGISGNISEKVGQSMRDLSDHCQIIAITHQPQIASKAHQHYSVQKIENNGRTVTRILSLDDDQHIREVASLMSGADITDSALANARELVLKSNR